MFEAETWTRLPFHFWTVVFFIFGSMVGSFLNVCIYRMPLEKSVISPPSHCPNCKYQIPMYLNMPIITWLVLTGKCANCKEAISIRYLLVELFTGCVFAGAWLYFGATDPLFGSLLLVLAYCIVLAGFIVATFIDMEHFIIPDEITLGGAGAGFVISALVPQLHETASRSQALKSSFLGILIGGGLVYAILQIGKVMFGRQNFDLPDNSTVIFTETGLKFPEEAETPYEEIFSRKSDTIVCEAKNIQLPDRCYPAAIVRLNPEKLTVNEDVFDPEKINRIELITNRIVVPREAMGLGDVKFMAAIGAFLGWQATIFSLMVSSLIGAVVGILFIVIGRKEWSSKIPYGPYIALAAVIWMFGGKDFTMRWFLNSL